MEQHKKAIPALDKFDARLRVPPCVLGIVANAEAVHGIYFLPQGTGELAPTNGLAQKACEQLARYAQDPEFKFSLPIFEFGTQFQRNVWALLREIPLGELRTYGTVARHLGSSARAVGQACGANPIVILTPCHRVIAANGIGGFSNQTAGFSLDIKRWLINHERLAHRVTPFKDR